MLNPSSILGDIMLLILFGVHTKPCLTIWVSRASTNDMLLENTILSKAKLLAPMSSYRCSVSHRRILGSNDGGDIPSVTVWGTLSLASQCSATPPPLFSTPIRKYFLSIKAPLASG